ncbi:hypothetical protein [Haladaptatus sp. DFWS20]|uniref:hypothetical protein n=1 Tax=Haladaptatus sp. DFWS20 TaxID=3403467 RepID=UPI003EBB62CC
MRKSSKTSRVIIAVWFGWLSASVFSWYADGNPWLTDARQVALAPITILFSYILISGAETALLRNGYELPRLRRAFFLAGFVFALIIAASAIVSPFLWAILSAAIVTSQTVTYGFWLVTPVVCFLLYDQLFRPESLLFGR